MNTNPNVRKPIVLTLAALAFVLVASLLLVSLLHTAGGQDEMGGRVYPNPRVRFAPLDGRKTPATLDGRRYPATLDGRRYPATLDGRKTPATLDGRRFPSAALSSLPAAPLTLVDGVILLALAILLLIPARRAHLSRS